VAQARWRNENAQSSVAGIQQVVETYEAMDAEFGITDLRWGLQHADQATEQQLQRLRDLNVGISMSGLRWQGNLRRAARRWPVLPRALASGITPGCTRRRPSPRTTRSSRSTTRRRGSTGPASRSSPDQQISREQALGRIRAGMPGTSTARTTWVDRGGQLADLLVLDRDYFSVSDDEARRTLPIVTVVGGRIVHDTGAL
jgi:predicted amidohydrolase YtcJ